MHITRADTVGVRVPFADDFPVNYGVEDVTHHVFVRIETDAGLTGYGEGTALPWFTGDVTAGIEEVARDWLLPEIVDRPIEEAFSELERFQETFPGAFAATAAVEIALLDLRAKRADVPLYELLGVKRREAVSVVNVLPALESDVTAERARAAVDEGYDRLKVKANGEIDTDVARINAVLRELPADGTLRVDANTAWGTYSTAARVIDQISDPERIEYLEQPVAKSRVDHMERLDEEFGIPIYADESVNDTADVERYGSQISGCHLKLAKSGSLTELRTMAERARAHDADVSVVSAFGTSLEATANLHLATIVDNLSAGVEICTGLLGESHGSPALEQAPELTIPEAAGVGVELEDALFRGQPVTPKR